ncbi:Protein containing YHS protein [archaeon GW2011_AR15]|nr:Protein containing YHS protein [archaeon GW2011_AR15]MBS3104102.1 LOG family protein [Candidatus Woesearchaeota archaeon]
MKIKIGVMGSSEKINDMTLVRRAREVGKHIARHNCILVNGATTGLPDQAAQGAKEAGGFVLGISPAENMKEHKKRYKLPSKGYDAIIFTGFGFNQRNILNIRTSDALVFLRGSLGTLNEFTIAFEDGKVIGVLENMGGISSFFDELIQLTKKKTGAKIIYEADPKILISRLVKEVKARDSRR